VPAVYSVHDPTIYAYASGNPTSNRGPTGKDPLLAVIGALAGTGYGIVNGIIAGDSRNELIADAIAGAAQRGLIGLTDGLSLLQGAVVSAGIESCRQIANSAVTGCDKFDKGGAAFAAGGSLLGDLVGGASSLNRAEGASAANHAIFLPEEYDNLSRFISLNAGGLLNLPYSAVTGLRQ
jgi:hypothetical protein